MDLLKINKIIDNPWSVGMVRAEKAGQALADVIMNRFQGERGVTLIGYSLGARVVYACIMALAEKRAFGLVDNVVMMGAPCPTEVRVWGTMNCIVTGRFVNVYSKNDYVLGFLYRGSSWQYGVAGLQKVSGVPGVENFDASEVVSSHFQYQYLVASILKKLGWECIDNVQVAKDEETVAMLADQEKANQKRQAPRDLDLNKEAEKLEKKVNAKNAETEAHLRKTNGTKRQDK